MPKLGPAGIDERTAPLEIRRCLRCLLLVMCTYPFAKKSLTLHLARGEGRECYFGCNLMQRKVLASSYQHLMAEAPHFLHRGARTASPRFGTAILPTYAFYLFIRAHRT